MDSLACALSLSLFCCLLDCPSRGLNPGSFPTTTARAHTYYLVFSLSSLRLSVLFSKRYNRHLIGYRQLQLYLQPILYYKKRPRCDNRVRMCHDLHCKCLNFSTRRFFICEPWPPLYISSPCTFALAHVSSILLFMILVNFFLPRAWGERRRDTKPCSTTTPRRSQTHW